MCELLQYRRSLVVSNIIKHGEKVGRTVDRYFDRMGGDSTVAVIGLLFATREEAVPGILKLRRFGGSNRRHLRRKTLVQPETIPPVMRYQVAKPHVRHFMKYDAGPGLTFCSIAGSSLHIAALCERDGANVFHSADIEIRHEQLVVFVKLIRDVEVFSVMLKSALGNLKPFFHFYELSHRLPRHQTQRYALCFVFPDFVGSGVHRKYVGRHLRRGVEVPQD